jgi:hypothetical protein
MKIKQLLEGPKPQKIPVAKPRNFVAKNATTSGAGAHKDKKKAAKQGDVKHKNKEFEMGETFTDTVKDLGTKVGDTLANALPKEMRPFDNQTAANFSSNISSKEKTTPPPTAKIKEQYVGSGASRDMQTAVDIARMNAKRAALEKIHGPNYTDVQMPDHEFGKIDLQPDGKGGYRASVPLTIKQAPQKDYLDAKPLPVVDKVNTNDYIDKRPLPVTDKVNPKDFMTPMESTRNPDLMSQTDYDRYQQSQMDSQKRNFKRDEMEHELGHEDRGMYFVVIAKNGKWEYTKAQPRQEGMNAAQRVINALHAKYPSMHLGMMGPDGKVYNYGKGK